jgi:hypothetical protein
MLAGQSSQRWEIVEWPEKSANCLSAKKKKSRGPSKRKIKARKTPKRQSRNVADKVKSVYRTVVDTIKGTDQLRNKMEPPATSETE